MDLNCHERSASPASLDDVLRLVSGRPGSSTHQRRASPKRLQRSQSLENTYAAAQGAQAVYEEKTSVPATHDAAYLHQFRSPAGYQYMQVKSTRVPSATPVVHYPQANDNTHGRRGTKSQRPKSGSSKRPLNSRAALEEHMEHEDALAHALELNQQYMSDATTNALHMEKASVKNTALRPSSNGSNYSTYEDSLEIKNSNPSENPSAVSGQKVTNDMVQQQYQAARISYQTVPSPVNRPSSRGTSPNVAVVQPQQTAPKVVTMETGQAQKMEVKENKSPRNHDDCAESDKSEALYDSLDETSHAFKQVPYQQKQECLSVGNQEAVVSFLTSHPDNSYPRPVDPSVAAYMYHGAQRKAWITPSESDVTHFSSTPQYYTQPNGYSSSSAGVGQPHPVAAPYINSLHQSAARSAHTQEPTSAYSRVHANANPDIPSAQTHGTAYATDNTLSNNITHTTANILPYTSVNYTTPSSNENGHYSHIQIPTALEYTSSNVAPVSQPTQNATAHSEISTALTGAPRVANQNEHPPTSAGTWTNGHSTYNAETYTSPDTDPIRQLESMSTGSAAASAYVRPASGSVAKVVFGGYGFSHPPETLPQPPVTAKPVVVASLASNINNGDTAMKRNGSASTGAATSSNLPQPGSQNVSAYREASRIPRPKNPRDYTNTIDDIERQEESFRPPSPVFEKVSKPVPVNRVEETQSETDIDCYHAPKGTRVIKGILKKKPSSAQMVRTEGGWGFQEEGHPTSGMKRSMSASGIGFRDSVEVTRSHIQNTKDQQELVRAAYYLAQYRFHFLCNVLLKLNRLS